MKLETQEIEIIKEGFEYLINEFGIDDIEEDLNDDESDFIYFPFPRDPSIEADKEFLVMLMSEIKSIKIHDDNRVTTDTITQRVVRANFNTALHYAGMLFSMEKDNIHISVISDPLLIGLAATKHGEYTKYYPPCSSHYAVNIYYPNKESRLSSED